MEMILDMGITGVFCILALIAINLCLLRKR